jgi:Tfp pilus assembly protein PilV
MFPYPAAARRLKMKTKGNLSMFQEQARRTGKTGPERGNSLIEVMISTGLLTMVVVGLYGSFSFGFGTIKASREDLGAEQIMLQKLETLRIYDWSKITSGYIPTNLTFSYGTNGDTVYDVSIAIAPVPLSVSYSNSLRQVTVSSSWTSGRVAHHRSMTTLASQNGIQTYKP